MRAIVIHGAGDLRLDERPDETPGPGEVLIAIEVGGVCGSDLHYYRHGGFGAIRLREPMILGHEVAGRVVEVGQGVAGLRKGMRVAINPSRPCGTCRYCLEGLPNHCLDMRFYGSAMRLPHIQGAFRDSLVAKAEQCVVVPDSLSAGEAAMAEPLSVALHAARQAGELLGRRVLVIGSGPIGALVILAARRAGAAEIVATDIADPPLAHAIRVGADRAVNIATEPEALGPYGADKGTFDVLFEASGSGPALVRALDAVRPKGVVVQLGLGGELSLPINTLVVKELQLRGSFRFHAEFRIAVELMAKRLVEVQPLITHTFGLDDAVRAFETAADRSQAMKAQIAFA
jgi:L-idonate 5-dehydrogenase